MALPSKKWCLSSLLALRSAGGKGHNGGQDLFSMEKKLAMGGKRGWGGLLSSRSGLSHIESLDLCHLNNKNKRSHSSVVSTRPARGPRI